MSYFEHPTWPNCVCNVFNYVSPCHHYDITTCQERCSLIACRQESSPPACCQVSFTSKQMHHMASFKPSLTFAISIPPSYLAILHYLGKDSSPLACPQVSFTPRHALHGQLQTFSYIHRLHTPSHLAILLYLGKDAYF